MPEISTGETMSEPLKGALGLEPTPYIYFSEIVIVPATNGYIVHVTRPFYIAGQYVFNSRKEMWTWLSEHVADEPAEGVNL